MVVGASEGGLEPIRALTAGLGADTPATIFVVQHMAPNAGGLLRDALAPVTKMRVELATDGGRFERGVVYVAAPDRHLVIDGEHMRLPRGPRENSSRPAIDPLFRSAAVSHATSVIGVLLSGNLHDGSAGLDAVHRCGGITIVQDPDEARVPEMPASALAFTEIHHRIEMHELATLVRRLVSEPAPPRPPVPDDLATEVRLAGRPVSSEELDSLGRPVPTGCPDCGGPVWQPNGGTPRYRCAVGHAFGPDAMDIAQCREIDRALWVAIRSLRDRAAVCRKLAEQSRSRPNGSITTMWQAQADESERDARLLLALASHSLNTNDADELG